MMKCEIIRNLIPLYLDKVCSEDSRKLVEEHYNITQLMQEIYEIIRDGTGSGETEKRRRSG